MMRRLILALAFCCIPAWTGLAQQSFPDFPPADVTREMDFMQMLGQMGMELPRLPDRESDPNRPEGSIAIEPGNPDSRYQLADLVLDTATHEVTRAGRQIRLSAKEYAMLEYLLRNKGLVLSREKIENAVWGYDYEGGTNVVDVYIRYLRQKIDDGAPVRLIHTVRGSGYVLKEGGQ